MRGHRANVDAKRPIVEESVTDKEDTQENQKLLVFVIPIAVAVVFSLWLMGVFG